ncbi:MAG TPA: hypothetical protein P5137_14370 [Candidatus Brocadiia bacterium]|nr:hypothetical protein [Candidatus Brocadiia bacterium]
MGRLWREADGAPARRNGRGKPLYWRTPEYDGARLVAARDCRAEGKGWTLTDDRFTAFDGTYPIRAEWPDRTTWPFPYRRGLMRTRTAGDSIAWTGRMFRAGVALDYVEGMCRFDVAIDGEVLTTIEHKQASGRFPRVPEFNTLLDGGKHTVKLTLREGSLNVGYFMISGPMA